MKESEEQRVRRVLLETMEQRWGRLEGLPPKDVSQLLEYVPLEVLQWMLNYIHLEEGARFQQSK